MKKLITSAITLMTIAVAIRANVETSKLKSKLIRFEENQNKQLFLKHDLSPDSYRQYSKKTYDEKIKLDRGLPN